MFALSELKTSTWNRTLRVELNVTTFANAEIELVPLVGALRCPA